MPLSKNNQNSTVSTKEGTTKADIIQDLALSAIDLSNPTDKEKNKKERNSPYEKPKKNMLGWYFYWSFASITLVLLEIAYSGKVNISIEQYEILSDILVIITIITFIISMKTIPGGYSMSKQAICHMGRIVTKKGGDNRIAAGFFFIYGLSVAIMLFFDDNLVVRFHQATGDFPALSTGIKLTALGAFMTSNVPIDVNEKAHYNWALFGFSANIYMSTYMLVYIIRETPNEWFLIANLIGLLVSAAIYLWGFFTRYRYAAFFQKIWIFFSVITFYLYYDYLLGLIATL